MSLSFDTSPRIRVMRKYKNLKCPSPARQWRLAEARRTYDNYYLFSKYRLIILVRSHVKSTESNSDGIYLRGSAVWSCCWDRRQPDCRWDLEIWTAVERVAVFYVFLCHGASRLLHTGFSGHTADEVYIYAICSVEGSWTVSLSLIFYVRVSSVLECVPYHSNHRAYTDNFISNQISIKRHQATK